MKNSTNNNLRYIAIVASYMHKIDRRKLMGILELKLRYTSRSHLSNTRIVCINTICICHKGNIIIHSDFVTTIPIMVNRFITITIVTTVVRIYTIIMLVSNS